MSQDTNEVETTCSYCGMPINPGRGIHGIGRLANSWLHKSICKDVTDRSESKYLRSHNIDTDQENDYFYIWSSEDWNQIPEESTDEASTDTESKVPELVY